MNNLSLFFVGLVLIYIPACLSQNDDKQCFSQSLEPSYPCCKGNEIVYTDEDGDWGVENNKWCGIGNGSSVESEESCFSLALGYSCCKSCDVIYTDKDGDWGVENDKWCGIKDSCKVLNVEIENPVQNVTDIVSTSDFEFSFLKLENRKKNMLYSPLSIEYALKMLQEGANNNTFTEINNLVADITLSKYKNIDNILSLANGLFIRDIYYDYVMTNYINTLKEIYDAEVIKDPFKSAEIANKWIEDKTLGIIKDILSDQVVQDPDNGMLIINALAIDMEWANTFGSDKTHGETFYLDNGDEMKAEMMLKNEIKSLNDAYYKDNDITVVRMNLKDYSGTQFEFMAIMPEKNLSGYVENVSVEQINEIDKKLKLTSEEDDGVNIKIPKFKFDYELDLKKDLINLGVVDAFDKGNADFSKMVDLISLNQNIYVSEAIHKADIEFTEKGVKAAAVTAFMMGGFGGMPMPKNPVNITINKPFMFIIRDINTKDIWFTGTVYKPNLWDNNRLSPSFFK
ncbi:Non-catalytic module family DOC2 [Piromyces sp. E2]|nr:Non-catalytic module family DOC2 [Piromyces sp. E2]|eukprot:OUM64611.1 Non-catalytic module family DOC2 [Piromyces sp. E2]